MQTIAPALDKSLIFDSGAIASPGVLVLHGNSA